jgi:hypothetical protein
MTVDIFAEAGSIFTAFNILNLGFIVVWAVSSVLISRTITETRDEWMVMTIMMLMGGLVLIFSGDAGKWALLIITVLTILIGFFKNLWRNK